VTAAGVRWAASDQYVPFWHARSDPSTGRQAVSGV